MAKESVTLPRPLILLGEPPCTEMTLSSLSLTVRGSSPRGRRRPLRLAISPDMILFGNQLNTDGTPKDSGLIRRWHQSMKGQAAIFRSRLSVQPIMSYETYHFPAISRARGRVSATFSNTILTITVKGTASTIPTTPQHRPQNASATRTTTGLRSTA